MPRISVLMPVYNGEAYLRPAIESILMQTCTDFEFIVVDDGSTDSTPKILNDYADPRILRLRNERNEGLVPSLNRGLAAASGEYVARQDADDISAPTRFARQADFLDTHPTVGLVGSWHLLIDASGYGSAVVQTPTENCITQEQLFYKNCFCHGSTMIRRECFSRVGTYREEFNLAEDWDLWLRIGERYELANLPEPLYQYRLVLTSVSQSNGHRQRQVARRMLEEAMARRQSSHGAATPLSSRALARYHLFLATDDSAMGCETAARAHMSCAFATDPALAQDTGEILGELPYRAFEICRSSGPANRETAEAGASFIRRWFAALPPAAASLQGQRLRVLAQYYLVLAFASFRARQWRDVPRNALAAIRHSPAEIRNRGLIAITLRSLLRVN